MLGKITNLAVLALLAGVAWYGYTNWIAATADPDYSEQATSFNCRQALANYAEDQAALRDDAYTLSDDERAEIKRRESDIAEYCN